MVENMLTLDKIKTQTVQVNEPIIKSALLDFFFTTANINKQEWQTKFFYYYFESSQNYFIASFKHPSPHVALMPHVLVQHYKTHEANSYDLFITTAFFALYSYGKLVYFKATSQNVSTQEVIHFLQQSLHIQISQSYLISDESLQSYVDAHEAESKNSRHEYDYSYFSSIKKTLHYLAFCLGIVACLFGVVYVTHFHSKEKNQPITQAPLKIKTLKTASLLDFFALINKEHLSLMQLNIDNSDAQVKLRHPNKNQLIHFLKMSSLQMRSLNYIKKEKVYELDATFILL